MRRFSSFLCAWLLMVPGLVQASPGPCARIVSLAPSVTETLFALGFGSAVVGVTPYSTYPAEVKALPKVGGLLDPNIEAIAALRPTVVMGTQEIAERVKPLKRIGGIAELFVDHRSVKGILASFATIADYCGEPQRGADLAKSLEAELAATRAEPARRPRVMVVVGGGSEEGRSIFVSGTDGYFNEIIALAGGENVVRSATTSIPAVSAEGLYALDPEVIIEVRAEADPGATDRAKIIAGWKRYSDLRAVRNNRVVVLVEDYITVPGPRIGQTLRRFREIIGAQ